MATALLGRVVALAGALGLAGVRLLVRPENKAAQRLYASLGFDEHATLMCQRPTNKIGD
jgi:ribosomal protein S18 acetylase RimI-like enzyme